MNFEKFLKKNEEKDLLRFITCGSVDDGKSTLIGRLLYDSHKIYEDQLDAVKKDSKKYGTQYGEMDLSLLVDGLQAEREQQITIDVAYRFFSTPNRKFIIADCPGHEQYTRNMATGASTADVAVILIDARNGITPQTLRHYKIVTALGVKNVIVAVNKMDAVSFSRDRFREIEIDFQRKIDHEVRLSFIPVSALLGDNVVEKSERMDWWYGRRDGETLLEILESIEVVNYEGCMRLPIQYVIRPNQDYRAYVGTLVGNDIKVGQMVTVLPQREVTKVTLINKSGEFVTAAEPGDAVSISLLDDIDITRGNWIVSAPMYDAAPIQSTTFQAELIWMDETPLDPKAVYEFKFGPQIAYGVVEAENPVQLNDIANVVVHLQTEVIVDLYTDSRETGSFIMIDRITNATSGAGMVIREFNIFHHKTEVTKIDRAEHNHQTPRIVWFTGLSGAGKSTIANALEVELFHRHYHTYLLDGDNLRFGLAKDLGFSQRDREENIRRTGEVAKLFVDAGMIVLCAFISPYEKDREFVRALVDDGEFLEVFVDTPVRTCIERDTKGLYKKAINGEIDNFTGISSPYEAPKNAEIVITPDMTVETSMNLILSKLIPSDK